MWFTDSIFTLHLVFTWFTYFHRWLDSHDSGIFMCDSLTWFINMRQYFCMFFIYFCRKCFHISQCWLLEMIHFCRIHLFADISSNDSCDSRHDSFIEYRIFVGTRVFRLLLHTHHLFSDTFHTIHLFSRVISCRDQWIFFTWSVYVIHSHDSSAVFQMIHISHVF